MSEPQLWISAFEVGCFYGLLGLCFMIIHQGARVFNFAVGAYAMLGGLAAAWMVGRHQIAPLPALAFGLILGGGAAVITEFLVLRRIERLGASSDLPMLIGVAATLFMIEQAAGLAFGRGNLRGVPVVDVPPVQLGTAYLSPGAIQLFVATIVIFGSIALWTRYSTYGRMLRAVGDNRAAASILGFPIKRIRFAAFVIAGTIAAITGIIFASKAGISFRSALPWALKGFLAVVIGGTGHILAPAVGGLLLGITEVFTAFYFGGAATEYAIFLVAVFFFSVRPEGLFAPRVRI